MTRILRLSKTGLPLNWLSRQEAATLYARDQVLWQLGDEQFEMLGGINKNGERSSLQMAPIIACDGHSYTKSFAPTLINSLLFRRDGHLCLYCGKTFNDNELTRDHVIPKVQGGKDIWTNVVAACRRCNQHKGGRTPEQANMELLAVPFEPNRFEILFLQNRQIRGDQMEYLQARFTDQRKWN